MALGAQTLDVLAARILWLGIDFELITSNVLRRHLPNVVARLDVRAAQALHQRRLSRQWRCR
jgi:hypothetical protein